MEPADFRWQTLFQRTAEPIFLLDRQRRILFVNQAWEKATGLAAAEVRGKHCVRHLPGPEEPWEMLVRALCCPPPEVLHGKAGQVRRPVPGRAGQWWDLEFLPLRREDGLLCVLGRVARVTAHEKPPSSPLTEKLAALRDRVAERYSLELFASSLPMLHRVADQVRLAGQTRAGVLLRGERGTGKQTAARVIHYQGPSRDRILAAIDCIHLPAEALATSLFGEEGLLRRAGIGTLYLKEPSHLPRDLQARMVAWLGSADHETGARVIAGTSADPAEEVRAGRLLEEFRCALATLVIELPPLRERQADLPLLVERLLERAEFAHAEAKAPPAKGLRPEAWELIRAYGWPANVRELYQVLLAGRVHAQGEFIEAADLPAYLRLALRMGQTPGAIPERPLPLDRLLEEAERRLIQLALRRTQGNKTRAAEVLSIWRPRLIRRMEALGIDGAGGEKE